MSWIAWPAAVALLAGCGAEPATVVTVDARPSVHNATSLIVTLANEGATLEQTFALGDHPLPATFSVATPGRTGALVIDIDAVDDAGVLVGRGRGESDVSAPTASVMLEGADFVVNTSFVDNQFPADDFDSNGFQIAADGGGNFTVVFRDDCIGVQGCALFARRFDANGIPLDSVAAAGAIQFAITENNTLGGATPAVGAAGGVTLTAWNFFEPSPGTSDGIACRSFDNRGGSTTFETPVSIEAFPHSVSVTAIDASHFALVWEGNNLSIRNAVVDGQCQLVSPGIQEISEPAINSFLPASAANGNDVFYTWIVDGGVKARLGTISGGLGGPVRPLITKTPTESVVYARVAALGAGFAVVTRWQSDTQFTGGSRIELQRFDRNGTSLGPPVIVTVRTGNAFEDSASFGLAHRERDDSLLVVWHSCNEFGDGVGCGVFGRVISAAGQPVGEDFGLATTTNGDQTNPSVVALPDGSFAATWKDTSAQDPDKSGSAVRARILYP